MPSATSDGGETDRGRRRFLGAAGVVGLAAASGGIVLHQSGAFRTSEPADDPKPKSKPKPRPPTPRLPDGLFSLGVASGDPGTDRVLLWTRLAPDPLAGGGMGDSRVPVHWELATDDRFDRVVRRGTEMTGPEVGHSVHVLARGLRPGTEYAYRFRAGTEISGVGLTRTVPRSTDAQAELRFVSASCQNWEQGYFSAWTHAVADDPALIVFLGDGIYEGAPDPTRTRLHQGTAEPVTVEDYRNRHAQYRSDRLLQAAHAHCPWIVTLDDHEIDNDWAAKTAQDPEFQSNPAFAVRRAAALQAWWEHAPVTTGPPKGTSLQVYRRLRWGDLATFHVLDTRQYRSDQVTNTLESEAEGQTMTGAEQESWLFDGLTRSTRQWQLVAQQTMVAQNDRTPGPDASFDYDNWDGYRWQRRRLMDQFARTRNPVVLTGDRHATWICDLHTDFDDPASPVVGAELCGTSISSGGEVPAVIQDGFHALYDQVMVDSPHWKFIDNQRGYLLHHLDGQAMRTEERIVSSVLSATGTTIRTNGTFVTEDGMPGVEVA